jgi:hypothetical protein
MVKGGIHQEAVINLVALRVLSTDIAIKRYLLGLALVALSYRDQNGLNLREGCLLCTATKADFGGDWRVVFFDGTEVCATDDLSMFKSFTHEKALAFALETIKPGIGVTISNPESDAFDKETADRWLVLDKKKRKALAKTMHPARAIADEAATAANAKKEKGKKGEAVSPNVGPPAPNEDEATRSE